MVEKRKIPPTKETENSTKKQEVESSPDNKLNQRYGIGAQLMSRMGYVSGSGLGVNSSGIVNPIQSGATSAPGFQRAGLGMMSAAGNWSEEGYTSSSSEDDINLTNGPKTVSFNRTNQTPKGNRTDITRLLDELSTDSVVDYFDVDSDALITIKDSINKLDDQSFLREKLKIKRQFVELNQVTRRLSELSKEIPLVENEMLEMSELVNVLNYLKTTDLSDFDECIHKILKLQDDEQVDKLVANQIIRLLKGSDWGDIVDPENKIVKSLKDLIENLKYRLITKKGSLNRSQTELFNVTQKRFESYCERLLLSKTYEDYETVITLLLNFESILKYVDLYDYIIDTCITPHLLELIKQWKIPAHHSNKSPRDWISDSLILGSERNDKAVRNELLQWLKSTGSKFNSDLDNKEISDVTFVYNYLMKGGVRETFECYLNFVNTFTNDYFMKFFTPQLMKESWDTENLNFMANQPTIKCVQILRKYVDLFRPVHYNAYMDYIFNDLNGILFQWILYSDEHHKKVAISWFNAFVNYAFVNPLPNKLESRRIAKTIEFLTKWDKEGIIKPIHNESKGYHEIPDLTVDAFLEIEHNGDPSSSAHSNHKPASEYAINACPIRLIRSPLKKVIEDYCEENGLLIRKLPSRYAQLPYGKDKNSIVPTFEISNTESKKKVYVAMKDDILWKQKDDSSDYSPIYLHKISQLLQ
ncbi:hypothetical protein C6P45_003543 [Maudiozyma exigua]|uniref:G-patch domain-containing protein n=1 Tax=Maudiozyma exigua TaxID=34358 RepID=A0A9P6VS68_MAUEX|nr:hypothetical protein C6P45_003543 [Kazachstania exigua]